MGIQKKVGQYYGVSTGTIRNVLHTYLKDKKCTDQGSMMLEDQEIDKRK